VEAVRRRSRGGGCSGHGWRAASAAGGRDSGGGCESAAGAGQGAGEMGQMIADANAIGAARGSDPDADGRYGGSDFRQGALRACRARCSRFGQMTGGAGEKTDPELEQQGDGPAGRVKHAEAATKSPAAGRCRGTECCGASAGAGRSDAVTGRFRSSRTGRRRRARRPRGRKVFCDMSVLMAKVVPMRCAAAA